MVSYSVSSSLGSWQRELTCKTFSLENMFHFLPTLAMMKRYSASTEVKLTKAYPT